ncbi:caspase family protein [Kitasatospora griseola]|uniref:caspase family protein n=2 Tax=Kitasatospora griseola TaxID=2064 RepID=UPI000698B78F|nr:caspase family protein [Kitasatospora griseola]
MAKRALVLATETYEDGRFAPLPGAAADGESLRTVLGNPEIGGFEVEVLVNRDTRSWRMAIERFFDSATAEDTLLLHLSCHGRKDRRNRLHFVTRDSELDALTATAVGADFLADCMEQSRSRRTILMLDCCYSGAFTKGMRTRGDQEEVAVKQTFDGRGRVVITSSTALQYSYESDLRSRREGQASVFTSAVVDGLLTGDADLDEDGVVSVNDLYDFISRRVPERVPEQTPTMSVSSVEGGQIELARNPRAAELGARALDRMRAGQDGLRATDAALAVDEAERQRKESEARAADLHAKYEAAQAEAARHAGAKAVGTRTLLRMLNILFGTVAVAAGFWASSSWVDGFHLPGGNELLPALLIGSCVFEVSFTALFAVFARLLVRGLQTFVPRMVEGVRSRRSRLTGGQIALLVLAGFAGLGGFLLAEVAWILPGCLRLAAWASGRAGFRIDVPADGWGDSLVACLAVGADLVVAMLIGLAINGMPQMPDEEYIEETGPGYHRRVRYQKKRWQFGPFYSHDTYEYRQGGSFDDF